MSNSLSRVEILVQLDCRRTDVPHPRSLRRWARETLLSSNSRPQLNNCTLTFRIVGNAESRRLNRAWRGKDKPTNVLSFAYSDSARGQLLAVGRPPFGDLLLCAPVIAREAREQGKTLRAHWAHMVVHGVLHLLGYDHMKERDAKRMEAKETAILARFGFADPYVRPG